MHNFLSAYDRIVAGWVTRLPDWLRPIMLTVTFIGEPLSVIVVSGAVATTAWLKGYKRIVYAEIAGLVGFGVNTFLKHYFHRARPDTIFAHSMRIKSYSFPSGHAYGGIVFYGLLAYLAWKYLPQPGNVIAAALLAVLIFTIGISRIYLGAHFPSDVTAGWVLGGLTLALIIIYVKP